MTDGLVLRAQSQLLVVMQDWLYEEGEDETKSTYVAKLNELRQTGQPLDILLRPTVRHIVCISLADNCRGYASCWRLLCK